MKQRGKNNWSPIPICTHTETDNYHNSIRLNSTNKWYGKQNMAERTNNLTTEHDHFHRYFNPILVFLVYWQLECYFFQKDLTMTLINRVLKPAYYYLC